MPAPDVAVMKAHTNPQSGGSSSAQAEIVRKAFIEMQVPEVLGSSCAHLQVGRCPLEKNSPVRVMSQCDRISSRRFMYL